MGLQIETAQSIEDELCICRLMAAKFAVSTLPRVFAEPSLQPKELGCNDAMEQILFLTAYGDVVRDHIRPVAQHPGQYHVYPKAGLCIEWSRTRWSGIECIPGRYYLDTSNPLSDQILAKSKQLYMFLSRHIKATYPRVDPAHRIFFGPHLVSRLDSNLARFTDGDGADIALMENVGTKANSQQTKD